MIIGCALKSYIKSYYLKSYSYECIYIFRMCADLHAAYQVKSIMQLEWAQAQRMIFARYYRKDILYKFINCVADMHLDWRKFSSTNFEGKYPTTRRSKLPDLDSLWYASSSAKSLKKILIAADLLLAEYDKTAWPNDIYGNQLCPIKKDGKIIGAYSIGKDGIDSGWKNESETPPIWLYDYIAQ